MKFRYLGLLTLGLFAFTACNDGSTSGDGDATKEDTTSTSSESGDMNGQSQQQGQQQQMTGKPQPAENVSDAELKKFAEVSQELQQMNTQSRQKMMKAVQGGGLSAKRFTKIQQAKNAGQQVDATEEEMKKYQDIMKEMQKIQSGMQSKMNKVIQDNGMTEQRYRSIGMAIRQDSTLQAKFRSMRQQAQPKMKRGQPQQQGAPAQGG